MFFPCFSHRIARPKYKTIPNFSLSLFSFEWRIANRPRRKFQISVEALFMLDFPSLKHKFSFFLDRKQTKITLDIGAHSITHSKHFEMPGFNETSTIRSLAFSFHDNIVTLYVDCVESSKLDIGIGLSKLYLQMEEPVMKLFRERKYPLHFDTSIQGAFGRANCQRGMHKHGNKRFTRNKLSADKGKSVSTLM